MTEEAVPYQTVVPPLPLLPYEQLSPLIRSGDFLLCQGESVFASLIRHSTKSAWSHVALLLREEALDRIMVFESVESIGCRNVPLSQYARDYNHTGGGYSGRCFIGRHRQIPADVGARLKGAQQAVDLLGTEYGKQDIASILARLVGDQIGMDPWPVSKNTVLICSEYVKLYCDMLGLPMPYNRLNYIAPCDIAESPEVDRLWELAIEHPAQV